MSPHSHPSMLPHNYPSMPPQPICLCKYCIYSTIYALYVVAHYLHITYLGYLHHPPPSIIHSSMLRNLIPPDLHPHHSRRMNEHRSTRRNQRSNQMNRNRRDYRRIRQYQEYHQAFVSQLGHEPLRQDDGGGVIAPNYPELIYLYENTVIIDISVYCIEDKSQENKGQAEGGGVMTPKMAPLLIYLSPQHLF